MNPVRAISLDLDGTLYRVPRLRVAWRLRFERGLLVALVGAREKMRHEGPFADRDALFEREVELVAPSFGLSFDEARRRLQDLRAALPEALTRGIKPYPGVRAALEAAHARGLKLAVFSDYEPGEKLNFLGLDRLPFAAILGADSLGALKPHPRGFEEVARRLAVDPSEVVHIGDREDLDVEGALAAGMRALRFCRQAGVETKAERVFFRWDIDALTRLLPPSSG
ncbi:MAG: HAD family hydrolase [Deltaproteobacteria bacterium]|nr:HAD family hydrolase [Deltaproteobacteria bacterium]